MAYGYPYDIMHMVDCVLNDKEPAVSAEHARHVIEIIELGYKAAETGQTQDMTTTFTLNEVGPKETKIDWNSTVAVGGKLASFGGGGLLERVAKKNVEKFVEGVQQGISAAGA